MKKNTLIVGGIAALAAIASIGTSFALYTIVPEDHVVNIGIRTGTDINYAISDVECADYAPIAPGHISNSYSFNIQGKKSADSAFQQPYVLAKLTVKVTSENTALIDALQTNATIGYKEGTYFATTAKHNTLNWTETDANTKTGTLSTYIYVGDGFDAGDAFNAVSLSIGVAEDTQAESLRALAGDYTVTISLTDDPEYEVAHVVGTMNGWTASDEYEMVMNIEKEGSLEWMWLGSIDAGNEIKAKHENGVWSSGDNLTVQDNLTGVYWTGNSTDPITISTSN